jgi:prophage regulatory protein
MSERLLRINDVRARVPYSRASIYQKIQQGEFPAPISMGTGGARAVAWLESEIDAWIASRIEANDREGRGVRK